jgi:putative ubiquitin-RnfH superfamily antitoxin RatB of RatAB toxin-antitoxin module
MRVTVAYSPAARQTREWVLDLAEEATIAAAIGASGLMSEFPQAQAALVAGELTVAVWGRAQAPGHRLRDQDRVEVLRALRVDPKVARRERFTRQGTRAAGLFARRGNAGGKASGEGGADDGGNSRQ